MLLNGAPLYDLSAQWAWQKALWPNLSTKADLLYIPYPPFDILPMALVALFPLQTAYILWLIGETLLLSILCYSLVNTSPTISSRTRMAILLLCLTSLPVFLTLVHGQLSFILALAVFFAWQNCKAGRECRGGLWLSLLLVKPQFFLIPFLLFLVLRRGRLLQGMLLGSAIFLTLSLLLVGPRGLIEYAQLLSSASQWGENYGIHPQEMQSWRSLVHRLLNTNDSAQTLWLWLAGAGVSFALLTWAWLFPVQTEEKKALFDLQWAAMLFATTFCSPHLNIHDLSILVVACVLIFNATPLIAYNRKQHFILLWMPLLGHILLWIDFNFRLAVPLIIPFQALTLLMLVYMSRSLSQSKNELQPVPLIQA